MSRLRVHAVGASVVIVLSFTMVGASPAVAAGGGLAGKSSEQVVSIARAAGVAKGSVHITEIGLWGGGRNGTESLDQTKTEGREVDSGPGSFGNGTILVIKGVVYVMGDATYLINSGFSQTQATTYAGKWIAFHKGDQNYSFWTTDETIVPSLKDDLPVAPYAKPEFTTLNGKKVVKIVGGAKKSSLENGVGTNTAYVSASPPYLLVENVFVDASTSTHITLTFSKWGEKVSLSPPSNPIPASSISSS